MLLAMKAIFSFILISVCSFANGDYLFFSPEMINSHLAGYTQEEKEVIEKDLAVVKSVCVPPQELHSERKPLYIATAGAPGAIKTTTLERFLNKHALLPKIAYIDPDRRGLRFMAHTYYNRSLSCLEIANYENYNAAIKAAYEKWRGASTYIVLTLLEEAFRDKRDIAYGATSTGEHIPAFLAKVKAAGYEIVLLLCSCDDALRYCAIEHRNEEQKFYQSTPEDALMKGKFFPMRMNSYFTIADKLHLFWSRGFEAKEHLVASFEEGKIHVYDPDGYACFIEKYESDLVKLAQEGIFVPSWEILETLYTSRFAR